MYNHNKAQQSKNRVHISWDIQYLETPSLGSDGTLESRVSSEVTILNV